MCHGGGTDIRDHFQIVRSDREFSSVQGIHTFDRQHVGSDVADLCSHLVEHIAKLLDMRFGSGVPQHSCTFCLDSGHNSVFGGGYGGFIHQDVAAFHPLFDLKVILTVIIGVCSQFYKGENVCVDPAPSDHIAARRGQNETAAAGAHRTGQQDGGTDSPAHIRIKIGRLHIFRLDLPGVRVDFFEGYTETFDQFAHGDHVPDHWHIMQDDGLVCEDRGTQERQCGVFIS